MSDVASSRRHPLVTIGLVTYRQERFVRESVRSVLAQNYSPLQVVICDDASPDATFDILSEEVAAYRGDHAVLLQRNSQTLGIGNFNRVMELANGEFVVIAHGDDISFPDRVQRLAAVWSGSGPSLLSSNARLIDEAGQNIGYVAGVDFPRRTTALELAEHAWSNWLFGGALAWDRKVFDVWGPLDPERSAVSTDSIIPFRAALLNGICIISEPLLKVRRHPESKANRYLHHDDDLVQRESALANRITQFLYMLETMETGVTKGLIAASPELRMTLVKSTVRCAAKWRIYRNQLLAQGRRAQWLPIDP